MIPKRITVGPYRFTLTLDENACLRDSVAQGSDHLFGLMLPFEQKIVVNPRQGDDMKRDTVLHEVLHAILLGMGLEDDLEERVISTVSPALLDTLRRNPDLVEYLTGS